MFTWDRIEFLGIVLHNIFSMENENLGEVVLNNMEKEKDKIRLSPKSRGSGQNQIYRIEFLGRIFHLITGASIFYMIFIQGSEVCYRKREGNPTSTSCICSCSMFHLSSRSQIIHFPLLSVLVNSKNFEFIMSNAM